MKEKKNHTPVSAPIIYFFAAVLVISLPALLAGLTFMDIDLLFYFSCVMIFLLGVMHVYLINRLFLKTDYGDRSALYFSVSIAVMAVFIDLFVFWLFDLPWAYLTSLPAFLLPVTCWAAYHVFVKAGKSQHVIPNMEEVL